MGLAKEVASFGMAWAAAFICRLINSTLEFVKDVQNSSRHTSIIFSNSVTSIVWEWKVSLVIFESSSKSMLLNCISCIHEEHDRELKLCQQLLDKRDETATLYLTQKFRNHLEYTHQYMSAEIVLRKPRLYCTWISHC